MPDSRCISPLATNNVVLQADNDITVDDDIASASGNDLMFLSGRSLTLAPNRLIVLNGGNLTARINNETAIAAERDPGIAQFVMAAGSQILTNGGNLNISSGTFGQTSQINTADGIIRTASATGNGGNLTLSALGNVTTGLLDTGSSTSRGGNLSAISTGGTLTTTQTLSTDSTTQAGDIFLTAAGDINVTSSVTANALGQAGNLSLTAGGDLNLTSTGFVRGGTPSFGTTGNIASVGTLSGTITLTSGGTLSGQDVRVANIVTGSSPGKETVVNARSILLERSSLLALTNSSGRSGDMQVNVAEDVVLRDSNIATNANDGTSGNAGDLTLNTQRLSIVRTPGIVLPFRGVGLGTATDPESSGDSGNLIVNASESVELIGDLPGAYVIDPTQVVADLDRTARTAALVTAAAGSGNSGNLMIRTGRLVSRDGAGIFTFPIVGRGGDLTISANEILLQGAGGISTGTVGLQQAGNLAILADRITLTDGALLKAATLGSGNAGDVTLSVRQLNVLNGSAVSTVTLGVGNGGVTTINNAELIEVAGTSPNGEFPSSIQADSGGTGNAGSLDITADRLSIRQGGGITTTTLTSDAGGDIDIRTDTLQLNDGRVNASTAGTGNAGNIEIDARSLTLDRGSITATSASGEGGNIAMRIADLLVLRRNSTISTTAGQANTGGNGGNINIRSGVFIAVPRENSDITANAFAGRGGNITISTQGLFGTQLRDQLTTLSDITASSEVGVDGTVTMLPCSPASLGEDLNATTRHLLEQGKQCYESGQLAAAIQTWKQAINASVQEGDLRRRAFAQYYLTVAYQDLGQWEAAEQAIAQAFDILESVDDPLLYAQLLNSQGSYQFRTGQTETALEIWKQAEQRYRRLGDVRGIALSQINQSQALRVLGFYRQARRTLEQLRRDLASLPNSLLKAKELQSLGVTLQVTGDVEQSRVVLSESLVIAQRLKAKSALAETLFQFGNTENAQEHTETALRFYQQSRITAPGSQIWLEASLNQLKLLIKKERFEPAIALMPEILSYLESLPASRWGVYAQVNFAESVMTGVKSSNLTTKNGRTKVNLAQLLARAVKQARSLKDARAEIYALGQLGHLYEQNQQWSEALNLTQEALQIAEQIRADDISASWQWQQGRLLRAQGNVEAAIAAYQQSVTLLESLRKDLVVMNSDVQFSFREQVEPVYRQLVQLLLQGVDRLPVEVQQQRLQRSREVIEALQLAGLENFFREACLTYKPQSIDKIDAQAAVIYPILLEDSSAPQSVRLEVILSLPNQPLQPYGTDLPNDAGRIAFRDLREALIPAFPPSQVLPSAQQLYNWLIRPAEAALTQHKIKQLVFVLDGYLRSLPMAVLHDGSQYLIEKYSLALTPGLQLLESRLRSPQQFRVLAGGITEARQGFPALPAVKSEIAQIKAQLPTQVLLDQNFTDTELQQEVADVPFSVVHLATHGQFSSKAEDTFVLAWNERINVKDLEQLLQQRELRTPIELLVLSACQTAKGNDSAALGMAGVAVRSGARTTIATLWSVQDQSTAEFAATFYQYLTQPGTSRAQALQQAQLALLRNPQYRHPYYWSPFVLLGNWL